MSTKFNVVEVERSCAEKYRKDLKLTDKITPDMIVKDGRVRLKVFQSVEQYNGIRSAIAWVYKVAWVEMPFAKELATYIIGISRHIAAAKQHLGLKLTKGKAVMKPQAYEMIAEHLFRSGEKRDIFNHLMFPLDWNLMKRSENCLNAKMIHIEFEGDHLKFIFEQEKGKQHDVHGPWHCLVLAFARYIFAFPECLQEGMPLFSGTYQYGRYSIRMHDPFSELNDDLYDLGINWEELGTHSARKGVGSMVANASTVGPPIVALCLRVRAGWKLGGVKDSVKQATQMSSAALLFLVECQVKTHSKTLGTRSRSRYYRQIMLCRSAYYYICQLFISVKDVRCVKEQRTCSLLC